MKTKTILLSIFLFSNFLIFQSCTFNDRETGLPRSSGKTSELLVIAKKARWDSYIGDSISNFFGQTQLGLPQDEPIFDVVCLDPKVLADKMFKQHHNIFIVDINPKLKKVSIDNKKNFWASPQRIIKIAAPSDTAFLRVFEKNKENLLYLFLKNERIRTQNTLSAFEDASIRRKLKKKYHLSMKVPGGSYIAKQEKNFVWIRKEPQKYSLGILIYYSKYTDTLAFKLENIIAKRDSVTKKYIPGSVKNSYMTTAKIVKPTSKVVNFNDLYAVEVRGLWEVENDFMGGPFLSYTLVDEINNRIVTAEGFVYAPNVDKRDYLLQLEAILYTLKFEKETENK